MERDSVRLDIPQIDISEKSNSYTHIYNAIRNFCNACDHKNVSQIKKLQSSTSFLKNVAALKTVNSKTLSDGETREEFRNEVLDFILTDSYDKVQDDNIDLLFFASAKFELNRLQEVIHRLKEDSKTYLENVNQTRCSDSAIVFVLKYGNVRSENFLPGLTILVEAGVDINKFDHKGKTAIDYVAALYESSTNIKNDAHVVESLKVLAALFLNTGIFKPENDRTMYFLTNVMKINESYNFAQMELPTKLFYWILTNKADKLLHFNNIKEYSDSDDGENTLLQLTSKKTDNLLPIVKYLLKNGADPNRTTTSNSLTPLELAAVNNNSKIFEEILHHKKTSISATQYYNFVRWRSQPMKVKLFELLLESDKLDPTFTYEKTGNTPLHYAILFSHKKAIQILLKRHSCLCMNNKFDKCVLDIIDAEDLEKYFDYCLALDNYTPYFSDSNYKMQFRFNCLIDDKGSREVRVVSRIGRRPNLEHLLTHPFIHTFTTLKWFKVKTYFWIILFLQAYTFLLLSILFYRLPSSSWIEYSICVGLTLFNMLLKVPIFLYCRIINNRPVLYTLDRAALHGSLEIILMVTMVGSFLQNQFRAFVFVLMAIVFLLTAGYHPRLSKWSLMLQQVFKTFTLLLMFFSIIVIAFSMGFHILFPEDGFFQNVFSSLFRTYIMTTGEFNLEEDSPFDNSGFGGYMLFLLFAMSMSLVIVNFWTGVAVTDIERIEKNSEVNASKNVIMFMLFIDYIYTFGWFSKMRNHIPNPLLFLHIKKNGQIYHDADKCKVNFFVNKENQFEEKDNFPRQVDSECFNKIRSHYYKLGKLSSEQEILKKLDELSKALVEIKASFAKNYKTDAEKEEVKAGKNVKKMNRKN